MFDITVITTDQVAQDDIIRDFLWDEVMPEHTRVTVCGEVTYRVQAQIENPARVRKTVAKHLDSITMFVCDPIA